jgi:hypothetical protein
MARAPGRAVSVIDFRWLRIKGDADRTRGLKKTRSASCNLDDFYDSAIPKSVLKASRQTVNKPSHDSLKQYGNHRTRLRPPGYRFMFEVAIR